MNNEFKLQQHYNLFSFLIDNTRKNKEAHVYLVWAKSPVQVELDHMLCYWATPTPLKDSKQSSSREAGRSRSLLVEKETTVHKLLFISSILFQNLFVSFSSILFLCVGLLPSSSHSVVFLSILFTEIFFIERI